MIPCFWRSFLLGSNLGKNLPGHGIKSGTIEFPVVLRGILCPELSSGHSLEIIRWHMGHDPLRIIPAPYFYLQAFHQLLDTAWQPNVKAHGLCVYGEYGAGMDTLHCSSDT